MTCCSACFWLAFSHAILDPTFAGRALRNLSSRTRVFLPSSPDRLPQRMEVSMELGSLRKGHAFGALPEVRRRVPGRPMRAVPRAMQLSLTAPTRRGSLLGQRFPAVPSVPALRGRTSYRVLTVSLHSAVPPAQGLFQPANDVDSCGVGFVGELSREGSRATVTDALTMLYRMSHRGACGCESETGALSLASSCCIWPHLTT